MVQLALEMMLCLAGSYLSWLTPSTRVMSSLVAGAEMMTFFTVAPRWALALVASVKWPVDSTTICAPTVSPGQLGGVALGPHLDLLSVDGDEVFAGGDFVRQIAEDRVVLEQVRQRCRAGQVVDGNKINFGIAERGAQNVAANAAEAVDANLNCHVCLLLRSG